MQVPTKNMQPTHVQRHHDVFNVQCSWSLQTTDANTFHSVLVSMVRFRKKMHRSLSRMFYLLIHITILNRYIYFHVIKLAQMSALPEKMCFFLFYLMGQVCASKRLYEWPNPGLCCSTIQTTDFPEETRAFLLRQISL